MTVNEKIMIALKEMANEGRPLRMSEDGELFLWDNTLEAALFDIGCLIETIEVPSASYKGHYLHETYTNYHTALRIVQQGDDCFVGL